MTTPIQKISGVGQGTPNTQRTAPQRNAPFSWAARLSTDIWAKGQVDEIVVFRIEIVDAIRRFHVGQEREILTREPFFQVLGIDLHAVRLMRVVFVQERLFERFSHRRSV